MAKAASIDMAGLDRQVGVALRLQEVAMFRDLAESLKPFDLRPADFSVFVIIDAHSS